MNSIVLKGERKLDYNTDVKDPAARKAARRLRIERRIQEAEKQRAISEGTYEEPPPEKPLLLETIETCEETLEQLHFEGAEYVSNIIVASDAKEVKRRETEEEEKSSRWKKLREESFLALQKIEEISNKWENILESTSPLELHENMKDQKSKCLLLIKQKNDLIKSFQQELKLADEKFMKDRKVMYQELEMLTKRIDEQVLVMRKAYRVELDNIERAIDITRKQELDKHSKIFHNLCFKRERSEGNSIDEQFRMVDNYHKELHKLQVDHEEKYRETKIQLETDIQTLEQELEQMKALCLLNSEKLDYNYQVLKKREEENVYIKNHQKRRLNKLQDLVNSLKKKTDEKLQSSEEEFKKLTKEVHRFYANVLDAEKKAVHISKMNDDRYLNIWEMKEEEAKALIGKILTADTVIHQQILGLNWTPPQVTSIDKSELHSYKTALTFVHEFSKLDGTQNIISNEPRGTKQEISMAENLEGQRRLLRRILEAIADKSGFLIEEKLDELLAPYSEDERNFVRLDNVFLAIGIKTEKDIELLKKSFTPYTICLYCEGKHGSASNTELKSEVEPSRKFRESSRQQSILQIRELEEKVSKLRIQAKADMVEHVEETGDEQVRYERSSWTDDHRESKSSHESKLETREKSDSVSTTKKDLKSLPETKEVVPSSSTYKKPSGTECNITHPLVIEKHFVLKALKDFITTFHSDRCRILTEIESKLDRKRFTVSRLLTGEDVTLFWKKLWDLLPSRIDVVWNAVYLALSRYLDILQERHKLNVKAQAIRRQNLELRRLLALYRPKNNRDGFMLPVISSVPDDPIDIEELASIVRKYSN